MEDLEVLKIKELKTKYIFILLLVVSALTAYFSYILGENSNKVYYLGFLLVPVFLLLSLYFYIRRNRYRDLIFVKDSFGKSQQRKRNIKNIRGLFDYLKEENKGRFYIDDQTCEDLMIDKIFEELDRTFSTPGEERLYGIFRTPEFKEDILNKRKKLMKVFKENKDLREEISIQLLKLGRQSNGNISSLLWEELTYNKSYKIIFSVLGILPIILPFFYFVIGADVIMLLILSFSANTYAHYKFNKNIRSHTGAIRYLSAVMNTASKLGKINEQELREYTSILEKNSATIKISKNTTAIGNIEGADMIADYFNILFLVQERQFFRVIDDVKKYRKEVKETYITIGELDAILSIASYRDGLDSFAEPMLDSKERFISIKDMKHPLIKDAVANSIEISEKGIILTGSNMSGKSTFLRTLGINALFAQTICTCLASEYRSNFLKVITSISPSDNLLVGKSYYLGEAEALLRIINSCEEDIPLLCIVDEIFRGTNPIERIGASIEILNYLIKHNTLPVVATHDLELTEMVKDNYECYYFTEEVAEEGLSFDYRMRKGVSNTRNAIKLLKYLGYPEEIVNKANETVDKLQI